MSRRMSEMNLRNRRHLPSLGSFATFEVAAKHLSFTAAANELHVSQAAVSQQIRSLETALKLRLFIREHQTLKLTAQGEMLSNAVRSGLDTICTTVRDLTQAEEPEVITFSATLGAASLWLKPLIKRYNELEPNVEFVVLASDEDDTLRKFDNVDLSLICGSERCDVGEELYYLFPETVKPVCSPEYLERYGPFDEAESLTSATLLNLHDRHWSGGAIGWKPITWATWFEKNDVACTNMHHGFVTNNYPMIVDSAIAGDGVILGWQHLVCNHIENGRLCVANQNAFHAERGNFLRVSPVTGSSPTVARFFAFIMEQCEKVEWW